jgi:hypothetical protein
VETRVLQQIGGFASLKSAVIDDCAFARRVKLHGFKIWLGLTHAAESLRGYKKISEHWQHGRPIGVRAAPVLSGSFATLHVGSPALYIVPDRYGDVVQRRYPLSFADLADVMILTYLPTLAILSSDMAVGALSASDRRVLPCHDLDFGTSLLARRAHAWKGKSL